MRNLNRLLRFLNTNKNGRTYVKQCIDMSDAAYFRIDPWFDVEIMPSLVAKTTRVNMYLWFCYTKDKTSENAIVAHVQEVPYEEVDDLVQTWVEEIKEEQEITKKTSMRSSQHFYDLKKTTTGYV